MTGLRVETLDDARTTIAALRGEITSATAPALHDGLIALLTERGRLVVDLSEVTFVSSAGLRVLVLLYRCADRMQACVELAGLSEQLRFVMAATGFLELFAPAEAGPEQREAV
jgi:anti-sigma B factor antagonist